MDEQPEQAPADPELIVWTRAVIDRNVTAVSCTAFLGARRFRATGSAKREKGDVFDPAIGYTIAVGRALAELSRLLTADGEAQVQAAEQVKRDRITARIKRTERRVLSQSGRRWSLSVEEIKGKFGQEAADRAARRREATATSRLREQRQS